jgi:hypothetical protein
MLCLAGALAPWPAHADLSGASIVVVTDKATYESVSVTTMAIVTQSEKNTKKSKIQCFFATEAALVGIEIVSKDQRRIEALYQQIATAVGSFSSFQITAYARPAPDDPSRFVADLESDVVYLILH